MNEDLYSLSKGDLIAEVMTLRAGIRQHRDATGQDLCWHHPALWGLLPDKTPPHIAVPAWPQFMRGCVRYRQSLDDQAPSAPRVQDEATAVQDGAAANEDVSRHWRGLAKAESAETYIAHLQAVTFPALRQLPGFVSASVLRRDVPEGVEFLVVTRWVSLDAIRAFAGDDVDAAVVPPEVQDMMVEYDRLVSHFRIVSLTAHALGSVEPR